MKFGAKVGLGTTLLIKSRELFWSQLFSLIKFDVSSRLSSVHKFKTRNFVKFAKLVFSKLIISWRGVRQKLGSPFICCSERSVFKLSLVSLTT